MREKWSGLGSVVYSVLVLGKVGAKLEEGPSTIGSKMEIGRLGSAMPGQG